MDTFRKIIASICVVLFVFTGILALLAFNIERTAFNSATYKQAFEKQNLYDRMPAILANALSTSVAEKPNLSPFLKALTVDEWATSISSMLPPEELKTLTDNALDSVFDYLNSKTDSAVVSLLPIKSRFTSGAGVELAKQILKSLPDCTAEQLLQMGLGVLGGDVTLCNPPQEMMGLMTPLIESQIKLMSLAFPDEVTIVSGDKSNTPNDPRLKLNNTRNLMKITPVFPLLFLFMLTIFAVRSLVDWLKWWGYPFLITGAISSLIAWLGSPIFGLIIQRVLRNRAANVLPPILFSTLQETVGAVIGQILKPVVIEGLILAVLGSGMAIVATYLQHSASRAKR